MSSVFDDKVKFRKKSKTVNTLEDYGMEDEYYFRFWADPSRPVLKGLLNAMITEEELKEKSEEELREMNEGFFYSVSEVILDTNIADLDFSTPESAEESFDAPGVDSGFLFDVLVRYAMGLMEESRLLKAA